MSCLSLEWSSKVLLKASGLDVGSILRGWGRIWGGFWEVFGKVWEGFWSNLDASGLLWVILGDQNVFGWFLGGLGRDLGVFWYFGAIMAYSR